MLQEDEQLRCGWSGEPRVMKSWLNRASCQEYSRDEIYQVRIIILFTKC